MRKVLLLLVLLLLVVAVVNAGLMPVAARAGREPAQGTAGRCQKVARQQADLLHARGSKRLPLLQSSAGLGSSGVGQQPLQLVSVADQQQAGRQQLTDDLAHKGVPLAAVGCGPRGVANRALREVASSAVLRRVDKVDWLQDVVGQRVACTTVPEDAPPAEV
jgi:hypothetical protein